MDLTRPVAYRGYALNTVDTNDAGVLQGCQINRVDYHAIDSVGYREKRSLSDGMDASDVYLGGRYVRLNGTLYGANRGDFFDRLEDLRACLLATAAFADFPSGYGYLPLTFEDASNDEVTWPTGYIAKQINARPLNTPAFAIDRDHIGGDEDRGMAVDWGCDLEAIDPRIYLQSINTTYFDATGTHASGSGAVVNRGPYPAPLNALIYVPSTVTQDRIVTLTAFGTVTKLTVPASSNNRTLRYNGALKVVTLEENGVEVLRMDLLDFPGALSHPLVPNGSSPYSWECRRSSDNSLNNIHASSRFWFQEAWV
jgi:hypothetical protein